MTKQPKEEIFMKNSIVPMYGIVYIRPDVLFKILTANYALKRYNINNNQIMGLLIDKEAR